MIELLPNVDDLVYDALQQCEASATADARDTRSTAAAHAACTSHCDDSFPDGTATHPSHEVIARSSFAIAFLQLHTTIVNAYMSSLRHYCELATKSTMTKVCNHYLRARP
mmetsp:Transcript_1330/g.3754  ORF Transcript_1330/g.3754 Transcript_1330/m.3754 type:complete len:110 (+) Transcript_1330:237-566(+)